MIRAKKLLISLLIAALSIVFISAAQAATADDINRDAREALQRLYRTNPLARDLSKQAEAVLVFPNIVKAGFIFGGSFGEGAMISGGKIDGYYNAVSASWGLQAGAQSYGYAVFLMNSRTKDYISNSKGWEIGIGPTVIVMDAGAAKNLSTTTLKDDAYAFIFNQQGLMAGVSLEGSKVSKIHK